MDNTYEIPLEGEKPLKVGQWVEIFEAYGDAEAGGPIQVKAMRVGSETLVFSCREKEQATLRSLRPHEGRVVALDNIQGWTRFRLRLQA